MKESPRIAEGFFMLVLVETIVSSCRAGGSFSFPPYKSFSSGLQKIFIRLTKVSFQTYKCYFTALYFMFLPLQHMYYALQLMYHVLQLMLQALQYKI